MTVRNRFFSLLLIYCFVASLAPHPRAAMATSNPVSAEPTQSSVLERAFGFVSSLLFARAPDDEEVADQADGLRFHLSEAAEQTESRAASKVAFASILSDAETENILKRLPPIKTEPTDEASFALRERSLPPPRIGQTIAQVFPPPISIAPTEGKNPGPLEVVRFSPEGEVPIAPNLSITFSQPMVAVSSQEEAAQNVPVKISPEPKGHWRWIGTKTLLFEPDIRFPMSTRYSVSVPAGTRSANGGSLAQVKTWNFTTPPPSVKNFYPEKASVQRRDTLMFAEFDQRIDPAAVLRTIRVEAGRVQTAIRPATPAEIEQDKTVSQLVRNAQKDRWLVFRAIGPDGGTENALPAASDINVSVLPGTPSAEGPGTTTQTQAFPFVTFGPLRITRRACGYDGRCRPSDSWVINFTNPLDTAGLDESKIKFEPAITGLTTSSYSATLNLRGNFKPRTTYRLTLDRSIKDVFGQALTADNTAQFEVGSADAQLFGANQNPVVLDPFGPAQYSVYTVNHPSLKVRLYSVAPEDWGKWIDYQRTRYGSDDNRIPPGRLVFSRTVQVESKPDEMVETAIDLREALTDDLGHVILVVEPTIKPVAPRYRYQREAIETWIQRTQIGLDAFVDRTDFTGWASSLREGAPLSGVELTLLPSGTAATTGADGTARMSLPPESPRQPASWLVARRGKDVAILPGGTWQRREVSDDLRWYVFDDRGLYRPGEEVHVKGWIRRVGAAKDGDVGLLNNAANTVAYTLKDSRGNEVTKGSLTPNALGGFDFALKLPATMNLGYANIALRAAGGGGVTAGLEFNHNFRVEEFRRPEFEVNAKTETEGPLFVGQRAETSVAASYFAGGGLPDAPVVWRVTSTATSFTPPNRSDFVFGKWTPWWIYRSDSGESHTETFNGRTDAAGKHRLRIDFDSVKPARPSTVIAEASVTDVNRQTWTAKATLLVHPADLYVGLKSDKTFVQLGEPLVVQTIVTDLDGKAAANHEVKMQAALLQWKQVKGQWQEVETKPQDCSVQSGADPVKCTFSSTDGGTYRVKATIHDDRGRANESEFTLWVAGGKQPPKRGVEAEKVELIPDRREYQAGDTAQILVQTPFSPAEAVMTLRRSGIVKTERFRIEGSTYTLRVPIAESWTPNIHVQVDLVGVENRDPVSTDVSSSPSPGSVRADALKADGTSALPAKRPAYASGELNLSIPPLTRKLNVVATPHDKALEPGGNTTIDVEAKDSGGKPVNGGELVVVVVDESVLALTGYKLADPIATFYAQRSEDTSDHHSRQALVLASVVISEKGRQMLGFTLAGDQNRAFAARASAELPMNGRKVGLGLGQLNSPPPPPKPSPGPGGEPIRLREDFNALAVFAPSVRTDANGHAQVQVKLPDNLTRYRVMAVAVAGGKQFGSGEAAITARLPLMARPSAPRFLNFGDRFELPIVLQNQTDAAMTVEIAVRATNVSLSEPPAVAGGSPPSESSVSTINRPLPQTAQTGRRVTVPANDRVEVRIPAAAVKAGTARFQIAAVSGRWSDAAEVQLPVWTPATTEAFATYGEIDSGAISQPVKAPANVFPQFGGLEIETSSTQLQALTDAMIYLTSYPYECSEQLSSRIISIAALRDVLTAFKAKDLPSAPEMEAAVTRDLKRLQGMQNPDGGFGFWRRGNESWPYLGIHVAHALARAKQKQFDVPAEMFEKSRKYLREIESHIPSDYSIDTRRAIIAYALYVRAQMGDRDAARARKLIVEAGLDKLSLESVGWLLSVLSGDRDSVNEVAAIRRLLNNRVTETAGMAHFICSYSDSDYLILNSDRRADGVILEALIGDQPTSDLIPKVVRGLLAHRTRGRWENTQENVFILLALDRYFNTFEKVTPDFVARAWLGQSFAGEQQFRGRSTDRQQIAVPMSYLVNQAGAQNLVLAKEGSGRLYYRIGMNYAPSDLNLKPADYGFTVERRYEAVDDPQDVTHDADGGWRIKAGARVRVRLTMVATSRRYHVALTDPMPAGFEALNPTLATTGSIPRDDKQAGTGGIRPRGYGWWWWRPEWYEHQNLRDERAEAFTSLLWGGVYKYSYVARATTPGEFIVPPSKAEEMYHPETFGRGKTDRVRIQ